jgi:N-acetylmuramoyl-L-alanine amidase
MESELRHCAGGTRRPRPDADPFLLLRIALVLFIGAAPTAAAQTCSVAVDVGHTAATPGATSARGVAEFHFNLALSRALRVSLTARGCRAMLVNEDGAVATLRDRTQQAGDAALFISIHHDSVQPQYLETWEFDGAERRYSDRFSGYSLFVSRDNPFPGKSLRCASAIGAALQEDGYRPSYYHAEPIPGESRPFADRGNGVHFYDQLVVLHTARQPAILIEAGVIVNREAEQILAMPQTRDRFAQAIAAGIVACLASATQTQ